MDYTNSNSYVVDAGTGQKMHLEAQAVPTVVSDQDMNGLIWENVALIKAAGLTPAAFDKTVATSYKQVAQAVKRLAGTGVRVITAAGPTVLTADDAGLVVIDAGANSVAVTMPAVAAVAGVPLKFEFLRLDVVPGNSVTVSRAGADVFAGGATSFSLTTQNDFRRVVGDGVSKWMLMSTSAASAEVGSFLIDGGGTAPTTGYLLCPTAPTTISRTTYARLWNKFGVIWGAGDGVNTFGMPWFAADYTMVQASGNVGTQTVGAVIAHVHSSANFALNTSTTPGGAAATAAQTTTNTGSTGGAANLPAGVRIQIYVKY